MTDLKLKIKYERIIDLVPYENNARTHTEEQVLQIVASMDKFGFTNPVLVDENKGIIAGHGRILAAELLGMKEVPTVCLAQMTDDEKRAYIIADNRLALNADWDDETLKAELQALVDAEFQMDLTGFDEYEIGELLAKDIEDELGDGANGEVKFSEEIGESNNYVVLVFKNDIDWLNAQEHFGLESLYSRRSNGKPWSKGIGRVVDGGTYLNEVQDD